MGLQPTRASPGTWKNWENIEAVFRTIMEEEGEFPSAKTLKNKGYGGLLSILRKKYGGLEGAEKKMGYRSENEQLSGLLERYAGEAI